MGLLQGLPALVDRTSRAYAGRHFAERLVGAGYSVRCSDWDILESALGQLELNLATRSPQAVESFARHYRLPVATSAGTYEIGPSNTSLKVRTTKAGLGARLAHDLTLEAKVWRGSITFDDADLAASSVEVTVAATSLAVVDSSGGVKQLSDADRREIARNINEKALLTNKYPDITFRSTAISGQSGTFTVTGDLTITGTTRPISLAVTADDDQVTVRAAVVQTQFGIKPYSAMFGALKINDEVEIRATLTLNRSKSHRNWTP